METREAFLGKSLEMKLAVLQSMLNGGTAQLGQNLVKLVQVRWEAKKLTLWDCLT